MKQSDATHKPSPIVFCFLVVLLGYFGVNVMQTVAEGHSHQDRVELLEQQIESLEEKKSALLKDLNVVKSKQFVESEARNKLNMAKKDEVVVIFPQQSSVLSAVKSDPDGETGNQTRATGYINDWYALFFE